MTLRSEDAIRQDRKIRAQLLELGGTRTDLPDWFRHTAAIQRSELELLEDEVGEVGQDLDWSVDGPSVSGHAITFRSLERYSNSIGRTFRNIGRDVMFLEGMKPLSGVQLADLVEPQVTAFAGSFGLRLNRPDVVEQPTLFGGVFERTSERLVSVLSAAAMPDPEPQILDSITGLRKRSLSALRDLSRLIVVTSDVSRLRWKGGDVVEFTAPQASRIVEVIEEVEPHQYTISVVAELELGARESGRFHLIEVGGENRHFRGYPVPESGISLSGIPLGARVGAELEVIETESPLLDEPRRAYRLKSIRML